MIEWQTPKYRIVRNRKQLDYMVKYIEEYRLKGIPLTIDTETIGLTDKSGLNPFQSWLLGISMCVHKYEGFYIPLDHVDEEGKRLSDQLTLPELVNVLAPLLIKPNTFLGHNMKFDYKILYRSGIELFPQFWDTLLAIQLLVGDVKKAAALKTVITQHSTIPPNLVQTFSEAAGKDPAKQPPDKFGVYAINDAIFTRILYEDIKGEVDSKCDKLFYECEMPLIPLLAQMELRGVHIDVDYFKSLQGPIEIELADLEQKYQEKYGVKISSTTQLGEYLTVTFPNIFSTTISKKGNVSTDVEVLQTLIRDQNNIIEHNSDPQITDRRLLVGMAEEVLHYRKLNKALSTYIKRFPQLANHLYKNGELFHVVNTSFKQIQNSGRLSSSPNVQNLTRDNDELSIRRGFIARPGYKFLDYDWSSAELRIVAVAAQEHKMLNAYKENPLDADIHALTTEGIFGEVTPELRHIGKTLNFSILYGATEYSVSKTLNCSKYQAKEHIDKWMETYPEVKRWRDEVEQFVVDNGYTETLFGRRRYLGYGVTSGMRLDNSTKWKWDGAIRELVNHIIQGTCADMLKFAMTKIAHKFAENNMDAHLITTTHDSIVAEVHESLVEQAQEIMKSTMEVYLKGTFMPVDSAVRTSFAKTEEL